MKNWSTDEKSLEQDPEKYTIWQLEQMVNFGLDGKKLNKAKLLQYWDKLNLDPDKKSYLHTLLYE